MTGEFPAQRLVTRKMFPFDDVIISAVQFQGQHRFERFRMTTPIRIHEWVWNDTHSLTPNGPFMMMVRVTFVWSVYDVVIELLPDYRSPLSSLHNLGILLTHALGPRFTRGQFRPSGIVVACVCVCLSVYQSRVRAIITSLSYVQAKTTKFGPDMQDTLQGCQR